MHRKKWVHNNKDGQLSRIGIDEEKRQAGMHARGRRRRPMKTPQSLLILHRILFFLPFLVKERGDWPEGISPTVSSRKAIHLSVGMRFSHSNPIAQIPKLAVLFAL
ncbi:hypothetical protein Peur_024461 [Populus x canadensis]